jgi:hypothetical protein
MFSKMTKFSFLIESSPLNTQQQNSINDKITDKFSHAFDFDSEISGSNSLLNIVEPEANVLVSPFNKLSQKT